MPVTELAILHLQPGVSLANPSFRAKLLQSVKVMENALGISGRRFVYYQGVEDPAILYLLGDWQSPSEHWDEFIPSPENQRLLELLKHDFDIQCIQMYHVDVPNAGVPTDSNIMHIGWYRVRTEDKARFEAQAVDFTQWSNEEESLEKKPAAGWRIEKAEGRENEEEWVRFCGWDNVHERMESRQTEPWKEGNDIHGLVLGSQLKHGTRIHLEPEVEE